MGNATSSELTAFLERVHKTMRELS